MDTDKVKDIIDVLEKSNDQAMNNNDKILESLRYLAKHEIDNKYISLNINQSKQQYGVFKFKFIRISSIRLPATT